MTFPVAGFSADELIHLLGAENVRTDADTRRRALSVWNTPPSGDSPPFPLAAVAFPADETEVAALVRWANGAKAALFPVGGASNVVGAGPSAGGGKMVVGVDLSRLDALAWDETSLTVQAGAGLRIGDIETRLNAHEYTLGHFPQSLGLLTVGGAIATDAIGLFSGRYGRQRDLTLVVSAVLPNGEMLHAAAPPLGSAAFDLHHLLIGTEGAFGIITGATLAMRPLPQVRAWAGFTFARESDGGDALRLLYRSDSRPALARLFDENAVGQSDVLRGISPPVQKGGALLLLAFEGDEQAQTGPYQLAYAVCRQIGGAVIDNPDLGDAWFEEKRAAVPAYLAAGAQANGGIANVLAISAGWSELHGAVAAVRAALSAPEVRTVAVEVSHAGPHGASAEIAFFADAGNRKPNAAAVLRDELLRAGLDAARASGASTAPYYGVGRDAARIAALADERGPGGRSLLRALKAAIDPDGVLASAAPGLFFDDEERLTTP